MIFPFFPHPEFMDSKFEYFVLLKRCGGHGLGRWLPLEIRESKMNNNWLFNFQRWCVQISHKYVKNQMFCLIFFKEIDFLVHFKRKIYRNSNSKYVSIECHMLFLVRTLRDLCGLNFLRLPFHRYSTIFHSRIYAKYLKDHILEGSFLYSVRDFNFFWVIIQHEGFHIYNFFSTIETKFPGWKI